VCRLCRSTTLPVSPPRATFGARKADRSVPVSVEFLITSFIVVVSPGTGVL
jgi:hypothetical protein